MKRRIKRKSSKKLSKSVRADFMAWAKARKKNYPGLPRTLAAYLRS